MAVKNFTEFFKEEKDIYVQNISNCQVSLFFDLGGGRFEPFLFTNSKDPVNLTRYVPFAAIKNSMELRKMVNRSPPALQLLTEQEYRMFFERKAQQLGLDSLDEAIDRAEAQRNAIQNHQPLPNAPDPIKLHEVVEDGKRLGEKKIVQPLEQVAETEAINPKVLNLCLQVHPSVPDQQKMTAAQLLTELDLVGSLGLGDWEYIQSHGYYKSVKNLARKKVQELAAAVEFDDDAPEVAKAAPKKAIKSKAAKSAE